MARPKAEWLWCYGRDDRPFAGNAAPEVPHCYGSDGKGEHPLTHLVPFHGILQTDGYVCYAALYDCGVTETACWRHVRRKLFDAHAAIQPPLALETLKRIAAL